jgi:hypothetical protein
MRSSSVKEFVGSREKEEEEEEEEEEEGRELSLYDLLTLLTAFKFQRLLACGGDILGT